MGLIDKLLINPRTSRAVQSFLKNPTHALMLVGPSGAGKSTLAETIAAECLDLASTEALLKHPHFQKLQRAAKKKDISIESIRQVIKTTGLKVPGKSGIRRVVLIENAEELSLPAQNALLKVLEEPPEDLLFILTATTLHSVLPTIGSRAAQLVVGPVSQKQAIGYFKDRFSEPQISKAWLVSGGYMGLLSALLSTDQDHPLTQAIKDAKELLTKSTYDSVVALERLAKDNQLDNTLLALDKVLSALQVSAIERDRTLQARQIMDRRRLIQQLHQGLSVSANQRLLLLELANNLKL